MALKVWPFLSRASEDSIESNGSKEPNESKDSAESKDSTESTVLPESKESTESIASADKNRDDSSQAKANIFVSFKRNWPQIVKILPGILFMWTAGMKLFWQTRIPYVGNNLTQYLVVIAWSVSVTGGALVAVACIYKQLKVNIVYTATAALHFTPFLAAIFRKTETANAGSYDDVAVLYIDTILPGFIWGLNFVTVFCYAVDYSNRKFRGKLVKLICKSGWIFTALMKLLLPDKDKGAFILKYSMYATIAVLVFITIYVTSKYSIDSQLQRLIGDDNAKEALETVEQELVDADDRAENHCNICTKNTVRPVILALGSRILAALVNNIPMLFIILWFTDTSLTEIVRTKSGLIGRDVRVSNSEVNLHDPNYLNSSHFTSESHSNFYSSESHLTSHSSESNFTFNSSESVRFTEIVPTESDTTFACHVALSTKVVAGIGIIISPDCIGSYTGNHRIIRSHRKYYIAALIFAVSLVASYYLSFIALKVFVIIIYSVIGVGIDAISLKHLSKAFPLKRRSGLIATVLIIETFFDSGLTATFMNLVGFKLQIPMAVGIAIVSVGLLLSLPDK